jgi:excisionase family DNA binding protein
MENSGMPRPGDKNNGNSLIIVKNRIISDRRISPGRRRGDTPAIGVVKRVFTTSEACRYLRVSRPTFLKLVLAGKIRAKKAGRGWKVLETELERFLASSLIN